MTPTEIHAELQAIKALLPPKAYVSAAVYSWSKSDQPAGVSAVPTGLSDGGTLTASAPTWEEAFALLRQKIAEWQDARHSSAVRRLALAIIEHAAGGEQCAMADLIGAGFTAEEVTMHASDALERAASLTHGTRFLLAAE